MEEKNWYEEWFDSPYYHLLYANRDQQEAVKFISALVEEEKIPSGASILDAACGKGRHSKTLAALGFDVTGIDLSKNSIAYAKQFENDHLKFDVWDMRQAYANNKFDYVVNLFSSFGYFDDDADDTATICAFATALKPGGTLILDYINTEYAIKNIKSREIVQRGETQFHIQKRVEDGFITKQIEFLANGEDHQYHECLKVINRYKFEEMLAVANLELQKTYGDYELNAFTPATSARLILIAQKKVVNND
ncbi:MAG TPA: class I SAM-dependent methyltransferase [Chitinophagales bacterium]|nr:class I SAM-dependent methyltransferase [Chitinophagales bacterium]